MEKLSLEDALMIENVVDKINLIIEELEYLDKRIDRLWKFNRMREETERTKVNKLKEL